MCGNWIGIVFGDSVCLGAVYVVVELMSMGCYLFESGYGM